MDNARENNKQEKKKRTSCTPCGIAVLSFILVIYAWMFTPQFGGLLLLILMANDCAPDMKIHRNLFDIQTSVEKYANDHKGIYPSDIQSIIDEGYIPSFPVNPFTRRPMEEIKFGSTPFEGNMTYMPYFQNGKAVGYYLIAFGRSARNGLDVNGDGTDDHVLQVLGSNGMVDPPLGWNRHPIDSSMLFPLPALAELLRAGESGSMSTVDPEDSVDLQ